MTAVVVPAVPTVWVKDGDLGDYFRRRHPHIRNVRYGVATARRAWLTAANVGNARPWAELDALRKRGARARA